MEVVELRCSDCGLRLVGDFESCEFCKFSDEDLEFIKIFIKCRGNIKEVEKELGISYPTVKNRLNEIVRTLGYEVGQSIASVIKQLENGELTVDEAVKFIKLSKGV